MSEYWKSTPKYWCKFCKVFVKDTKLERQQHDATPRHQGSIQKQLRSLHKDKELEDRQKQRAKDEVARLNGMVGSGSGPSSSTAPTAQSAKLGGTAAPQKATFDERKRQMQQLAQMGVAVPDEFRKEMAMAGDWQTVKVTRIERPPEDEDSKDAVAFGIRKRKFEDQEEEEAILGTGEAAPRKNRNWGSRMKTFPGSKKGAEDDLDALLGGIAVKKEKAQSENDEDENNATGDADQENGTVDAEQAPLKKSDSQPELELIGNLETVPPDVPVKIEDHVPEKPAETPGAGIVFKKRKKPVK